MDYKYNMFNCVDYNFANIVITATCMPVEGECYLFQLKLTTVYRDLKN